MKLLGHRVNLKRSCQAVLQSDLSTIRVVNILSCFLQSGLPIGSGVIEIVTLIPSLSSLSLFIGFAWL